MDRRRFLAASAALGSSFALRTPLSRAQGRPAGFADMHTHFSRAHNADIRDAMTRSGMLVLARAISADRPVIRHESGKGFRQVREPQRGELAAHFDAELERHREEHKASALVEVVDAATLHRLASEPRPAVVLAAEGGDFLEGDPGRLEAARRKGLVHLQLVHYRVSEIGDISTAMPVHNGLSALGQEIVRACNRLGILVDVAHATHEGMAQALDISTRSLVYSHGHVISGTPHWTNGATRARGIAVSMARRIAERGGVVGIWPALSSYRSLDSYAGALLDAAATLGAAHVGVGSDMSGLPGGSVIPDYEAFAALEGLLSKRGVKPGDIAGILGANYLRVLREALTPG